MEQHQTRQELVDLINFLEKFDLNLDDEIQHLVNQVQQIDLENWKKQRWKNERS